jgi:hypothetical protein
MTISRRLLRAPSSDGAHHNIASMKYTTAGGGDSVERKRKMKAPARLVINDGVIALPDGDTQEYYRQFQRDKGIEDGETVCVMSTRHLQQLADELEFLRSLRLCA